MNEISVITAIILLFVFLIIILILINKSQKKREEERLIWEESKRLSEEYEEKVKSFNHKSGHPISSYGEKINKTNQSSEKVPNKMSNYLHTHDSEVVTTVTDNAVDHDKIAKYSKCLGSNSNNNQSIEFIINEDVLTKYCGKSTEVVIPETVVKIENHAFNGCGFIKTITIPDTVTEIGVNSFSGLRNLTRLYMPKDRFDSITLPVNMDLGVYEREDINEKNAYLYTVKLTSLFAEISQIAIPFTKKIPLNRLLEIEDELELLFDFYYVERLKQNNIEHKILETIENRELLEKLLSIVQFEIAVIYLQSLRNKAISYFQASSLNGNLDALYNLACLYGMGHMVEKDNEKSFLLMKQCAEKGHVDAMFTLAQQYQKGIGTKIDIQQAKKWFLRAGDNGNKDAYEMLSNIYLFQ